MNEFPPLHHLVNAVLQCARALEKRGDRVFAQAGLTTQYFNVLCVIAESPEPMLASTLADRLVTSRSNVTGIVRRMERAGLISRRPHPADRRSEILTLNSAGQKIYRASLEAYFARLNTLERAIPAREVPAAVKVLQRLIRISQSP